MDEELLSGVVIFADSNALTAAALALLGDANLRYYFEKNAMDYMSKDATQYVVNTNDDDTSPSALYHLVNALNDVAGRCVVIIVRYA
jgi:hypothetical protein